MNAARLGVGADGRDGPPEADRNVRSPLTFGLPSVRLAPDADGAAHRLPGFERLEFVAQVVVGAVFEGDFVVASGLGHFFEQFVSECFVED